MGITLLPSEVILKSGGANYQKGWEAVGGKLILTSLRLCFNSHKMNHNTGGVSIDLRDIEGIELAWSKLIIPILPNGLVIRTHDGSVHKLIVVRRSKWVSAIKEQIAAVTR